MAGETIKLTVKAVIPPRDLGLRKLMREYAIYKKVLIPKVKQAVRSVVKDKSIRVYAQQKWMADKKLNEYLKNLPFHPMPFHNQSVFILRCANCAALRSTGHISSELKGVGESPPSGAYSLIGFTHEHKAQGNSGIKPAKLNCNECLYKPSDGRFWIHFKTKEGEAVCYLHVPAKYHSLIEQACGEDNPVLGQVELIEDCKYGWVNCHICLRLPKPEPYEPKGWLGVDTGFRKLATSILATPCIALRSTGHTSSELKGVAESPSFGAHGSIAFTHEHKAQGNSGLKPASINGDCLKLSFSHPTFHGKEFKTWIIQLRHLLKQYARKGKAWKKWDFRLKHTIKYAVGVVAKEIVSKAKRLKAGVAMENLTFKATTKGYIVPRYKLMIAIKTLCEREGVPFKLVPSQYTSITCPKCGYADDGNRSNERFECLKCGYKADADIVGAMNIALKAFDRTADGAVNGMGLDPIPKGEGALRLQAAGCCNPPKADER